MRLISYLGVLCLTASSLTGCGFIPTLELTEEQSNLIAEYAAGKLIEYVKGHPGGLMTNVDDIDLSLVNPGLKKEEEMPPELPPMPADAGPEIPPELPPEGEEGMVDQPVDVPDDQEALVDTPAEADAVPTKDLSDAFGLADAEVEYDRYEIVPTYPENAEEIAFSMKAAPGKQLLIVHFNLMNPTESDIEAHTDSSGFKVRLMVNGSDKLRADVTFLDNDLMNFNGLLTPGSSVDSVLVFEIQEGSEISSMDLLVLEDGTENKYHLM